MLIDLLRIFCTEYAQDYLEETDVLCQELNREKKYNLKRSEDMQNDLERSAFFNQNREEQWRRVGLGAVEN